VQHRDDEPAPRRHFSRYCPGRHAALLLDQAGWHLSAKLAVPDNITIVPLPAKCPELNPQENVWQFMRGNWLSNRVFPRRRRPRRSLLPCLEQIGGTALAGDVDRNARLGTWVLISESWYKT
jgi:hypothetical protein